nr:Rab family GTPase [Candidatus Njordarchaeum guaymaensis]
MNKRESMEKGANTAESYFKIIVAGEADVGKTALVNRYSMGEFVAPETIGIDFSSKSGKSAELGRFKFSIWDLGGEVRFRFILPEVCKGAKGVMLLFDLSNPKTFKNLDEWVKVIRSCMGNVPVLLVGAKADLQSKVPEELIKRFVKERKLSGFVKVSAKQNKNVNEAFQKIIELTPKEITQ